jgi:aminoglycoside phosphotransferase (APT) family kinase protein
VRADVHAVGRWLADFQHLTVRGTWASASLIDEIDVLAESADPLLENHEHRALLVAFTQAYTQAVQIIPLPTTAEHGDFTLPNVLVPTEDGEADLRVIDWEFQREQGNPLMDVGSFMLSLLRRRMVSGEFPVQIAPNTPPAWFLAAYAPSAGLPVHLAPAYYLLRVLDRVRQQPVNPAISHLILAQWTPMLRPALAFGVRMSVATGEDYGHNLGS